MKKRIMLGLPVAICFGLVTEVLAQNGVFIDATGFLYESGPNYSVLKFQSSPGETLSCVAFIDSVNPELGWDLAQMELTLVMTDLVSQGEVDFGGGMFFINYLGGTLDIVAQPRDDPDYTPADYGIDPPNATAPSSFWDGEVLLHGVFTNFYMVYYPTLHVGNFETHMTWTGGTQFWNLIYDPMCTWTAGVIDPASAPVPQGYELKASMHYHQPSMDAEQSSWGQVKNLYR